MLRSLVGSEMCIRDRPIRTPIVALDKERVKHIQSLNKKGEYPEDLMDKAAMLAAEEVKEPEVEFADVTGQLELPNEKKKRRRPNKKRRPTQAKGVLEEIIKKLRINQIVDLPQKISLIAETKTNVAIQEIKIGNLAVILNLIIKDQNLNRLSSR